MGYALTKSLFEGLFSELRNNEGNKHQKTTLERTHIQFATRVHKIFHFLHDITNPWITIKTTIFTHLPIVLLTRFMFCRWRNNWLLMTSQWPNNCNANQWNVISNSLDTDFIQGYIHVRSCKKTNFVYYIPWYCQLQNGHCVGQLFPLYFT